MNLNTMNYSDSLKSIFAHGQNKPLPPVGLRLMIFTEAEVAELRRHMEHPTALPKIQPRAVTTIEDEDNES